MSFLDRFTPGFRARMTRLAETRTLADGEILVRRGELGGDLYLVTEGALAAVDGDRVRSVTGAGHVCGELGFLDGGARSVDLVGRGPTTVLCWRRDPLRKLLRSEPGQEALLLGAVAAAAAEHVRRLTGETAPQTPEVASVALERGRFVPARHVVETADGEIKLSPKESKLLAYLTARPGRNVAYRALLDEVWGYASQVESRTVFATVHRLRAKIERDPASPRHLVAVAGEGYRFEP